MSLEKQRHHYVSQFWMLRFRDAIPFMKSDAQFTSEAAKLGIGASHVAAIYSIFRRADRDSLELSDHEETR